MNLYFLERPNGQPADWDGYIDAVVVAKSEKSARQISPGADWPNPDELVVTFLGKASKQAVALMKGGEGIVTADCKRG